MRRINHPLVIGVAIIGILLVLLGKQNAYNDELDKDIANVGLRLESVSRQGDILREEKLVLSDKNILFLDSISSLNTRYRESENRRIGQKRYYEKRLRNVDNLNVDSHVGFYADRFPSDDTKVGIN